MKREGPVRIGGEFELDPNDFSEYGTYISNKEIFLYSSGSTALMAILESVNNGNANVVHLPYYICYSVVNACLAANFKVSFYETTEEFLFPLDYLDNIGAQEVLLTVNYFGFIDDNPIIRIIKSLKPDVTVISDHVQSFWTYKRSEADFSFTSLRKHFAIPGGAFVYSKSSNILHNSSLEEARFLKDKTLGGIFKHLRLPDEVYLKLLESGEEAMSNKKSVTKASSLEYYLYEKTDLEDVRAKRKRNYELVYEFGNFHDFDFLFPYKKDIIPMNVPIILENRNNIRKSLMANNIFLPVHWPIDNFNASSKISKALSDTELSLVIDQRYSTNEIEYQLESLLRVANYG